MTQSEKQKQVEQILQAILNNSDDSFIQSIHSMIISRYGDRKSSRNATMTEEELKEANRNYMRAYRATHPRKPMTDEQRRKWNEYNRKYRHEHPEKVKKWNDDYIIRKAAKLAAETEE